VFVLVALTLPLSHAATLWTGPNITWTKSASTPSDTVLAGKVVLTRGSRDVLYNIAAGETNAGATSPKGTMWAFGTFASHTTFQSMESMRNGNLAARILNQPMVMWMVNDDIFVSVMFTTWGMNGAGTVTYTRSTAGAVVAPTVNITTPSAGATFVAPASVELTANANVSGGTVTNVEYFAGTTSLGHATVSPFSVTANIPAAGSYALKAVATAGGISGTSAVVNITVVSSPTVTITAPGEGAVFAAPATVNIAANATVSGGTVTNVSFYNQTTLLGSDQSSPFSLTASNLAPGAYSLTAVATASGVSGTSAVVNVTVVSPIAITLTGPSASAGLFSFSYSADPGLSYVIQSSSNLFDWTSVTTNVALSSPVLFSEELTTNLSLFYRVGRLPNP
jgi:hypothetical protein